MTQIQNVKIFCMYTRLIKNFTELSLSEFRSRKRLLINELSMKCVFISKTNRLYLHLQQKRVRRSSTESWDCQSMIYL